MHEISLVCSIIEMLSADAKKRDICKINYIRLVLEQFSGVNQSALQFALENVTKGTILDGTAVEIVINEAKEICRMCDTDFSPQPPFFECPKCGNAGLTGCQNRQLYIDYYEGD